MGTRAPGSLRPSRANDNWARACRSVSRSWKYILFGLGLDTGAGLLVLASSSTRGPLQGFLVEIPGTALLTGEFRRA